MPPDILRSQLDWRWGAAAVAACTGGVLRLGVPLLALYAVDHAAPARAQPEGTVLAVLLIGLATTILLEAALRAVHMLLVTGNTARLEHLTRLSVLARVLHAQIDALERQPLSRMRDRFAAIGALYRHDDRRLTLLMHEVPFALLALLVIAQLAGRLVLVPLLAALLLALCAWGIGRLRQRIAQTARLAEEPRAVFLTEIQRTRVTVKALAVDGLMQRHGERLTRRHASTVRDAVFAEGLMQTLGVLLRRLTVLALAAAGGVQVIAGTLTPGSWVAVLLLGTLVLHPVPALLELWLNRDAAQQARLRVAALLALPREAGRGHPPVTAVQGALTLEGISFGYRRDLPPVLRDIDLHIAAGSCVGIAGARGHGKTTLLLLMNGLLRPWQGWVRLDGLDVAAFDPESVRRQVAFLPHEAPLYDGTVLDNLTHFRGGIHVEIALRFAEKLGLDETLKRLPDGFATRVGMDPRAVPLPRGLRQCIGMVRALVATPRIVLWDEADAGLDPESDLILFRLLRDLLGDTTLVLASQRPALLALASARHVLRQGRLHTLVRPKAPPPPAEVVPPV